MIPRIVVLRLSLAPTALIAKMGMGQENMFRPQDEGVWQPPPTPPGGQQGPPDPGQIGPPRSGRVPSSGSDPTSDQPETYIHSPATKALRKLGFDPFAANYLIRDARQGLFQFSDKGVALPFKTRELGPAGTYGHLGSGQWDAIAEAALKQIEDKWNARRVKKGKS